MQIDTRLTLSTGLYFMYTIHESFLIGQKFLCAVRTEVVSVSRNPKILRAFLKLTLIFQAIFQINPRKNDEKKVVTVSQMLSVSSMVSVVSVFYMVSVSYVDVCVFKT